MLLPISNLVFSQISKIDSLETKVTQRTSELEKKNEELKSKNNKLAEYAFINAHKLRAPVAKF